MRESKRQIVSGCAILLWALTAPAAHGADRDAALYGAGMEFGASVGNLLVTAYKRDAVAPSAADPDQLMKVSEAIRSKIEAGRLSSQLVRSNLDFVSAAVGYIALGDPEPASRGALLIAAWAAKKTGDQLGTAILGKAQEDARAVLSRALQESVPKVEDLANINRDDALNLFSKLRLGGQPLSDAVREVPGAEDMLRAAYSDLLGRMTAANLAKTAAIQGDVTTIRSKLSNTSKQLEGFRKTTSAALDRIQTRLATMEISANEASAKLDELKATVSGNAEALRSLAFVSFGGWSSAQKLQALRAGLFTDLSSEQRTAAITALEKREALENAVRDINNVAHDLASLTQIASNLGVSPGIVKALSAAQTLAASSARFAGGDVLGAVSGLTSLLGIGAPDAATQRHAELMNYLHEAFAKIDEKLNKIIDLQVKTLVAINRLAASQQAFRIEVVGRLDAIEASVHTSLNLLQGLVLAKWDDCRTLVTAPEGLNHQLRITNLDGLIATISVPDADSSAYGCARVLQRLLTNNVAAAAWSGEIIAGSAFPDGNVISDPKVQALIAARQKLKAAAYERAVAFFLRATESSGLKPAMIAARLAQPVANADAADVVTATFTSGEVKKALDDFTCTQSDRISEALKSLLCVGVPPGAANPPRPARLRALLNPTTAPLLGPQAYWVVDMGTTLATIVDFAQRVDGSGFRFVNLSSLTSGKIVEPGKVQELRRVVGERKGQQILARLQWLTEIAVLQQALMSGDWIARMAEKELYDPSIRALNVEPQFLSSSPNRQAALDAMRVNPVLARNTVLLALRHAIEDSLGGADKARRILHRQSYYRQAMVEASTPSLCKGLEQSLWLQQMFPKWQFEYRATEEERKTEANKNCPAEVVGNNAPGGSSIPAMGKGIAVRLADFYVLLPTAAALGSGTLEQDEGLRLALIYRDKLSQALIDRTIADTVRSIVSTSQNQGAAYNEIAVDIVGNAWAWAAN